MELRAVRHKSIREVLKGMKLKRAADLVRLGYEETFSYYDFPVEHWKRIRTKTLYSLLTQS